jgi:short-subunit dehydrogenase
MLQLNNQTLTTLAYAYLKSAKTGDALINVSSALAFMPTPTMALYAATKAFVTSLSESLWFEYKDRGVYVMGLCPGLTDTNFQAASGVKKEELPKALVQTPEHVVEVALKALADRRKPTILTGIRNHMFAGVSRLLPRKSLVTMTGGMMPSHRSQAN